jgi:hypothetical protein
VSQSRIVELIVVLLNCVLVADSNSQPVAGVLVNPECHCAAFVSSFLKWRFEQTEMIVVSLGGFNDFVWDDVDSIVLELSTELEVKLWVKDARVICHFLERLYINLKLLFDLFRFFLQIALDFLLNTGNSPLNVLSTDVGCIFRFL